MSDSRVTQSFEFLAAYVEEVKGFYEEVLDLNPLELTRDLLEFKTAYALALLALSHAPSKERAA